MFKFLLISLISSNVLAVKILVLLFLVHKPSRLYSTQLQFLLRKFPHGWRLLYFSWILTCPNLITLYYFHLFSIPIFGRQNSKVAPKFPAPGIQSCIKRTPHLRLECWRNLLIWYGTYSFYEVTLYKQEWYMYYFIKGSILVLIDWGRGFLLLALKK